MIITRNKKIQNEIKNNGFYIFKNVLKNPTIYLNRLRKNKNAHSNTMWELRYKIKKYFVKIWNTNKLVSSYDGCSLDSKFNLDWHIDQNMSHGNELSCVQGVLALTNSTSTDLLIKSHNYFTEFGNRCTSYNNNEFESYIIPYYDDIWKKNLQIFTAKLNAGDLLLFDSRIIHRVVSREIRSVVYISMVPRLFVSKDIQKKRQIGFKNGIQTTHWCSRFIKVSIGSKPENLKLNDLV